MQEKLGKSFSMWRKKDQNQVDTGKAVASYPAGVAKGKLWFQESLVRTASLNCVHCPVCKSVMSVGKASVTSALH